MGDASSSYEPSTSLQHTIAPSESPPGTAERWDMELRTLYQSRCSLARLCLVVSVFVYVRIHNVTTSFVKRLGALRATFRASKNSRPVVLFKPKFLLAHQRTHRDVIIGFRISRETRGLGVPCVRGLRLSLFDGLDSHLALRPLDQSPNLYSVGKHGIGSCVTGKGFRDHSLKAWRAKTRVNITQIVVRWMRRRWMRWEKNVTNRGMSGRGTTSCIELWWSAMMRRCGVAKMEECKRRPPSIGVTERISKSQRVGRDSRGTNLCP